MSTSWSAHGLSLDQSPDCLLFGLDNLDILFPRKKGLSRVNLYTKGTESCLRFKTLMRNLKKITEMKKVLVVHIELVTRNNLL